MMLDFPVTCLTVQCLRCLLIHKRRPRSNATVENNKLISNKCHCVYLKNTKAVSPLVAL